MARVRGTQRLVDAGLLVEVLPAFVAAPMPVSLLYPHRRLLAPRVKAILNWITQVVEPWLADAQAVSAGRGSRRAKRLGH